MERITTSPDISTGWARGRCARLRTATGKALYAKRKSTIEPTFGVIKQVQGFRQFLLRGFEAVNGEWNLVCIAFNLKKLHALRA